MTDRPRTMQDDADEQWRWIRENAVKDDLLERLDNARTATGDTPLDALWAEAADRIRQLEAKVRFYERRERGRWVGSQTNCQ
jgi:hypothetical protein